MNQQHIIINYSRVMFSSGRICVVVASRPNTSPLLVVVRYMYFGLGGKMLKGFDIA